MVRIPDRRSTPVAAAVAAIHLNARLQPMHRGDVFEDPRDELLAEHAPGSRVVGGGTEFTPQTGPLSCDTEVELTGDPEQTLRLVMDILEHLGAPVGSWAQICRGDEAGDRVPASRTDSRSPWTARPCPTRSTRTTTSTSSSPS